MQDYDIQPPQTIGERLDKSKREMADAEEQSGLDSIFDFFFFTSSTSWRHMFA